MARSVFHFLCNLYKYDWKTECVYYIMAFVIDGAGRLFRTMLLTMEQCILQDIHYRLLICHLAHCRIHPVN